MIRHDCVYGMKRGWWCRRERWHDGPCALLPRWWNWSSDARMFRQARHL